MRFFALFFMVFITFVTPFVQAVYDTDVLNTPPPGADCSQLSKNCPNSGISSSFQQSFELISRSCQAEQVALKCESLSQKNPQLAAKIRNCSPQALCEDSNRQAGLALKGCFWNAPGEWGTDIWDSIKKSAQNSKECLNDKKCSDQVFRDSLSYALPPLLFLKLRNSAQSADLSKVKDTLTGIYDSGRDWVKEKGVELQCFNRQSQAELICYGVLNVFAPGAALKAGSKVPQIINWLKLTPAAKAEKTALEATGIEKRASAVTSGKRAAESSKSLTRSEFIEQNLRAELTTTEQNRQWMKLAENIKPDRRTKFFEVENSVMKMLNDTTQDKNFVTALTNKQKLILKSKMDELAERYPQVEILPYSDFKAMRFALRPKPPATALPPQFEKELGQVFQSANNEFTGYMKTQGLVRAGDQTENWFRAGFGETADQATLASRYSRNIAGENKLWNFSSSSLQENLGTSLKATEMFRKELQSELKSTGLMEKVPGSDQMTFRKEVFEAVRKTSSPEELKETVEKSLGTRLSDTQARKIRDYSELVDEFSPGIHIAKREVASLSDSTHGGLSVDFSGLGALNLKATATALAKSDKIEEAVVQTRLAEKSVTQVFQTRKDAVRNSIQKVLDQNGISSEVVISGDDLVVKPSRPIPASVRSEIANELPKVIDPSSIRTSHVPSGINLPADRMLVGTHGETLEKLTRKNLQGEISKDKMDQIFLMVDMEAKTSGQGSAKLIMGAPKSPLDDLERQKIKRAFEKAVQDLNQSLKSGGSVGSYRSAG